MGAEACMLKITTDKVVVQASAPAGFFLCDSNNKAISFCCDL